MTPRTLKQSNYKVASISLPKLAVFQQKLQASARFILLKGLPLIHFLEPEAGFEGDIANRTIEDICSLEQSELKALRKHDAQAYQLIARVLSKLAEDLPISSQTLPSATVPKFVQDYNVTNAVPKFSKNLPVDHFNYPLLNSVQAEELLDQAISRLARSAILQQLSQVRLGAFWDRKFGSAPFEESITFKQLSEMRASALIEKRSFGQRKIRGVLESVEKALVGTKVLCTENQQPMPTSPPCVAEACSQKLDQQIYWQTSGVIFSSSNKLLLNSYLQQLNFVQAASSPLVKILKRIPQELNDLEFLLMLHQIDLSPEQLTNLLAISANDYREIFNSACKKLDLLTRTEAAELRSYWDIALRSPGIKHEKLVEIFYEPLLPEEFVKAIVNILLMAIGAQHPIIYGMDLSQYWTINPSTLQMTISGILATLPKSDRELKADFAAMLPFIDLSILEEILLKQASLDKEKGEWVRRGK